MADADLDPAQILRDLGVRSVRLLEKTSGNLHPPPLERGGLHPTSARAG